ncbi:hypothetical protein SODALDRAFT_85716 [Sodiomyces alkalinus F11]|uniref:Uncharacterized protein n=1 Tax=Sodiomyces alkalinus (strain CBS 110278 / VKM F-3762 / F11) TaxID=1314773 RepID=A0A3N2PJK7_SODAK|nr:hypothetical protein SODALDRAFT_85716 [Sodiomyces alkalinus F11]ROT34564.1 hypothetical protein SODALDRAFT_85716 [Sodiomyces alkalinus F11]
MVTTRFIVLDVTGWTEMDKSCRPWPVRCIASMKTSLKRNAISCRRSMYGCAQIEQEEKKRKDSAPF